MNEDGFYYSWLLLLVSSPCHCSVFLRPEGKEGPAVILLVAMSYLFFWMASGWHFLLLAISTCTDWIAGRRISESKDEKIRKRWLIGSLTINLGSYFATFKYLDFIIESLNLANASPPPLARIRYLPDSFSQSGFHSTHSKRCHTQWTFSEARASPTRGSTTSACYASFFPQLVGWPNRRIQRVL